jgi:mono/diheme cytochrome c family protein
MDTTKRSLRSIGAVVAIGALSVAAVVAYRAFETRQTEQRWAMLATYCTECHNDEEFAGNVVFEGLTPDSVPAHAETFEAAVRKLRGRLMPPPGNPQPDQAEIDALVAFLERAIDSQNQAPKAAHVPIQRLNRTEYAIAVKDLLGVDIDAEEHLPTEIEVDGFTNIAAALSTSPAFLEQYISVARAVAHLAVGTPNPKLASAYFPPPADDQDGYVDGLPLGTRGGTRFEHNFPADGEYHINITDLDVGLYPRSLETEHTLVILIDRTEVFRAKLGGVADLELVDRGGAPARAELMARFTNIPVRVAAGVHEVVVTFIERSRASTDEPIFGFTPYGGFSFRGQMRVPRVIGGIEVEGPFGATGLSRTASRDKIFVCQPESPAEERTCAERITATLARRAFRRPVDQTDVDRLMPFYEAGRQDAAGFDAGIERMITALLASPDFLYRGLVGRAPTGEAEIYELSDLDLASRLSFFVWSQGPDEQLLEIASAGQLRDAEVLRAQAKRMLADPRADALVTGFALAWLNVDELESVDPDDRLFPEFGDELRTDFETEIGLFLSSVLLGDENVQRLLTADYTFLNERLAKHYGIAGVRGPQFRRVTLEDERRFGLLGKAAVLMRTSYGDRTSPVLRGAWVLEKLMGTPPTPPPAGVETDLSTPAGEQPKTIRVRLEQHRTAPNCNACHGVIDPYGLALENFTVTGRWRDYDREADAPIDAKTALPSGIVVANPVELREALLRRDDQFVQALTQKLMMYALGRELEYHDMPQVRAVVRAAAKNDYRLSAIVAGIVDTDAFRMQAPPHESGANGDQATASLTAFR